ncbi:hypothetical protein [Pandoraea pulmonicola]|uniref:Uncharacterized protein n=1 Tax=Pandoraea pulmonicola TaxID=93221 RepID=A0AAJ4ZB32_PANPU|nr:hypothetical protein [Pandoraea pulmonicola]SUA90070.1 Uncharacterised protein [Pandoraea pulmonicola]
MLIQTKSPLPGNSINGIETPTASPAGQLNGRPVLDVTGRESHGVAKSILAWCRSVHREVLQPIFNRVSSFVGEVSASIRKLFTPVLTQQGTATAGTGVLIAQPKFSPDFADKFGKICDRLILAAKNGELEPGLFRQPPALLIKNKIIDEINDNNKKLDDGYSKSELASIVKSVVLACKQPQISDILSAGNGCKDLTEIHGDVFKLIENESERKCAYRALETLSSIYAAAEDGVADNGVLNKISVSNACLIYSLEEVNDKNYECLPRVNEICGDILKAWGDKFTALRDRTPEDMIETTHL